MRHVTSTLTATDNGARVIVTVQYHFLVAVWRAVVNGSVLNVPGLYRNTVSGRYYGVKKIRGNRKERSLRTPDRKIAERRHREWITNLQRVDRERERMTLRELLERFVAVNQGRSVKTQGTNHSIIRKMMKTWPGGIDIEVRQIRPSHLDEWLALHEQRLKNTSYNRYAGFLKQLFEIAVKDRIIAESPFEQVTTRWKKPQEPIRCMPTIEQFQAIVDEIRAQRYTKFAAPTADFVEFLGLAGVGQAEAASLTWGDVDWQNERISFRRHKTDARFYVPIYSHLRPFLERLKNTAVSLARNAPVFHIHDATKALKAACERLGYPNFSQRNIRQCLILRLWKAGVDKKLIAKWQGHQDGGQLIMDTYTEVFGGDDAEYEQQQLAKLGGQPKNVDGETSHTSQNRQRKKINASMRNGDESQDAPISKAASEGFDPFRPAHVAEIVEKAIGRGL
jgi:integrase